MPQLWRDFLRSRLVLVAALRLLMRCKCLRRSQLKSCCLRLMPAPPLHICESAVKTTMPQPARAGRSFISRLHSRGGSCTVGTVY
jgi:hypothetical protein